MIKKNKLLMILVVGMGVILIMGFGALIMGILFKVNIVDPPVVKSNSLVNIRTVRPNFSEEGPREISIPKGSRIRGISSNSSEINLLVGNENVDELLIFDSRTVRFIRRYIIKEER